MRLDMFDLCSENLQQKCIPARDKFKEEDDRQVELASKVSIIPNAHLK